MQTLGPYWLGVAAWLVGFMFYLYGPHWRYSYTVARIGTRQQKVEPTSCCKMLGMKFLHWRGIAELSFDWAAASYAQHNAKRRLNRFEAPPV